MEFSIIFMYNTMLDTSLFENWLHFLSLSLFSFLFLLSHYTIDYDTTND